ncbi:glycerophosphodiester phosphodiesterase [Actinacidiphila glaucinigra]|uniref:glycerophosphodiester phosphodiesterase n=1 Tax=Actinacidiphila glaucinigra TaxID=235986 RepID=UPI0029B76647|nr:glycerophosphodiester phosphodiesterase [Streptomyces sp. PA03-3a]
MAALAIAHRGDPYRHRENTLPSLRSAVRAGADAVEMDVRLTRDGVPVLLHDPTLKRLWGVESAVAGLAADRLPPGVPTLHEALAAVGGCRALIDLTLPESAGPVLCAVRDAGAGDRTYYCGEAAAVLAVRDRDPAAEIALTWKTSAPVPPLLLAELRPRWINLRFGLVRAPLVEWARGEGLLVGAWTVDLRRTMRRLERLGVDAVTSNRIDVLRAELGGR